MDNSRCVILVPASRHIEPHCEYSLRQLEAQSYIVRRLYGFAQVDVVRNRLASESIADGFEELMWIDSDIAFEPQSVQRLRSHGLPIVCGLYAKKLETEWSSQFLPGQKSVTLGEGGGLIEVLYAAAGFLLGAPPGLPGGPAPATAPHVLLEGRSTHNPVLPSDGDPFRRRPPLSRRGLRFLRTQLVVAGFRSSPTRRSVSSTSASTATVGKTRRRTPSLSFLPIENVRRRRAGRCLTPACLFSTIHQKAMHEPHRVWSQVLPAPTKTKITVPHTTARASLLLVPSTHLILVTATFVAIVPYHPS